MLRERERERESKSLYLKLVSRNTRKPKIIVDNYVRFEKNWTLIFTRGPSGETDSTSASHVVREHAQWTRLTETSAGHVGLKNVWKPEWIKMVSPIQLKHSKECNKCNNRKQHLNLLMIKFGNNNLHFFVQLFNMKEVPEIPQLEDRLPCI